MNIEEIERRLRAIEDVEAIKKLKARYCVYCDEGYNAGGIAGLFTEDGVWDGGLFGCYEGRDAIRSFFQEASQMISFALHYVTNSIVEVDGDQAQGTWYLFQTCLLWSVLSDIFFSKPKFQSGITRVPFGRTELSSRLSCAKFCALARGDGPRA